MKRAKRLLALLLAAVMLLTLATACSKTTSQQSDPQQSNNTTEENPASDASDNSDNPYSEHVKLTFMTYVAEGIDQNDPNDRIKNYVQDKFNCEIEIQPFGGGEWDKVDMMLASGEYPDLFKMLNETTMVQAYEDGVLYNFDDALDVDGDKYPALKEYLDRARNAINLSVYDGDFYYVPTDTGVYQHGLWVRMDWLDELGLSIPETYDDLYNVLKTIKEENPGGNVQAGISMPGNWWLGHIYTGFVGSSDYVVQDGKVYHRQTVDGIREAYEYLHKLYSEGLLDQELFVGLDDQTVAEKFGSGKIAFMLGNCYSDWLPRIIPPIETNSPEAEVDIINLPAGPAGAHQLSGNPYFIMTAISKNCEHPDRAMAVLDFLLSDEGRSLVKNGIEGVHYTTDASGNIIRNEEEYQKDKFACDDYRYHWMLELVTTDSYYIAPDYPYADTFNKNVQRLEEGVESGYIITPTPQLNGYTSEVTQEYGDKINDIISQYEYKFITGELELNDENWQAYMDELNSHHYQDLVDDWTQAYNANS